MLCWAWHLSTVYVINALHFPHSHGKREDPLCRRRNTAQQQRAEQCFLDLYSRDCWVMEWRDEKHLDWAILSWEVDDHFFPWLSTQHHYLPLQLDITLFVTALNYIYLHKWAINVRMVFPGENRSAAVWEKEGAKTSPAHTREGMRGKKCPVVWD